MGNIKEAAPFWEVSTNKNHKKKPLRMANNLFLVFFLLCTPSVFTLQCYENQKSAPTNCQKKNNEVVQGIADAVAGIWDLAVNIGKTIENEVSGTNWIKNIGDQIKQITGGKIDLENRESNSQWVQNILQKMNFNLASHCWVTFKRSTGATESRGCGRTGYFGQVGGKLLKYFEEDNLHVLAGTDICFSVPVVDDLEMCLCKTDECNQDKTAAKKSLNIPDSAEPLKCAKSDCPVTDLSTVIDGWKGFNSACYMKDSEEKEHCFTTEGIYDEDVVRAAKLVQARSGEISAEGVTFTKTSGGGTILGSSGFLLAPYLLMTVLA